MPFPCAEERQAEQTQTTSVTLPAPFKADGYVPIFPNLRLGRSNHLKVQHPSSDDKRGDGQ